MTRSKVLVVVALLLATFAVGATASVAPSAAGTNWSFNDRSTGLTGFWERLHSFYRPFTAGAMAPPKAPAAANGETQLRSLNRQVASAINTFRVAHGLAPLTVSVGLNASSRQHSLEMGARGYFDHPSADGTAWWKRIQNYYGSDGYEYWTAGENLLWSSPNISAADAMRLWIQSPEHLRNLKDPNWSDLGVSSVHVLHARGVYDGETVTIITTDFGARH